MTEPASSAPARSCAVAWAVFAALSTLVASVSLVAGPAMDRESR